MKIRDIKDTLNADSRNVSILCTSPNINKWSKWKPVRFNKDCNITPLDLYSVNYGLMLPVGAATPQLASDNEYVYQHPTGGNSAPFRMGDFRNYNHNAIPPVSNYMGDVTVDVDMMNNFQFGVGLTRSTDFQIGVDELIDVQGKYLCCAIEYTRNNNIITVWKTAQNTIGNGGDYVAYSTNEPPFSIDTASNIKYYLCASDEPKNDDTIPVTAFYPLPFGDKSEAIGNVTSVRGLGCIITATGITYQPDVATDNINRYSYNRGAELQEYYIIANGTTYIEFTFKNDSNEMISYDDSFSGNITIQSIAKNISRNTGYLKLNMYDTTQVANNDIITRFQIPPHTSKKMLLGIPVWHQYKDGLREDLPLGQYTFNINIRHKDKNVSMATDTICVQV